MGDEAQRLQIVLFPFLAQGHMIPALDIARLFAARDVKATIITTAANAPTFNKAIGKGERLGDSSISLEVFKFPAQEAGLPEGCENVEQLRGPETFPLFFKAVDLLQEQLEQYLEKERPDCLVSDMFFPWSTDSAAKFGIPRLVFHGTSYFSLCAQEIVQKYEPYKTVSSDEEPFVLPRIPHEVKMVRTQIPEELWKIENTILNEKWKQIKESEIRSYGVIVNSFYELEPDYAEFFKKELGRRAWHIGPVSLCNKSVEDKTKRGKEASVDGHDCLTWLNSMKPASVIYICFGSRAPTIAPQLHEIAVALEKSGQSFIWVVRNSGNEEWLPEAFEQRMAGRGRIIRGWAPQVLILEHEAVGAFMTHCGWNSTLEGISAGVQMVTWPIFAEQFYNEKLVTQILGTGVPVGAKKWIRVPSEEDVIYRDAIEKALREIMEGDETEKMRRKAKQLKDMAWRAVENGGSSYSDLTALINELRGYNALTQH